MASVSPDSAGEAGLQACIHIYTMKRANGCASRAGDIDTRGSLLEQGLFSILPVAKLKGGPSPVACVPASQQLLFGKPDTLHGQRQGSH